MRDLQGKARAARSDAILRTCDAPPSLVSLVCWRPRWPRAACARPRASAAGPERVRLPHRRRERDGLAAPLRPAARSPPRYKNALFRPSAAGGTETPRPGVTITRDEYGVPSIDGAYGGRRLVRRGVRRRAGPAVPDRALPPGDDGPARGDPRQQLPRRRPDRPPRLLHGRRARTDVPRAAARPAGPGRRLPRRGEHLGPARAERHRPTSPASTPRSPPSPSSSRSASRRAIGVFLARTVRAATARSCATCARCVRSAPRRSTACCRSARPARRSRSPRRTRSSPTSPARRGAASGGRSAGRSRRAAAGICRRRKGTARPGRARARPWRPAPGRVGGSSMFAVRKPQRLGVLSTGPQLGFSTPSCSSSSRCTTPGWTCAGSAAGIP
jgi:hypothetical protein